MSRIGWDDITERCEEIYPTQHDPLHYGTVVKWEMGGNQPLDGISIYDGGNYWHFVTYGLSEIYEKETDNPQISGYGMEFTFKLKKNKNLNQEKEIKNICGILQNIARMTFETGEIFNTYEYLHTGSTRGIDCTNISNITGFITVQDSELKEIDTVNGHLEFIEFVGITNREIEMLQNKKISVKELYEIIGTDVTDFFRKPVA